MKHRIPSLILLLSVLFLFAACQTQPDEPDDNYTIPVILNLPSGALVVGDNPCRVEPGEDAVFEVELSAGFSVRESSDFLWDDGRLTVKNVTRPTSVELMLDFDPAYLASVNRDSIPIGQTFSLQYKPDDETSGSVRGSVAVGSQASGTEVTLTAESKSGGRFIVWTFDKPLSKGGTPLSYDPTFSFPLSMNTTIIANFAAAETATVLYDANGGVTEDGFRYLRHDVPVSFYFYPHALANQGQFSREGYVLYAYNTEPDGSGTEYTFGASVLTPESGTVTLYAQWAKATDPAQFTYTVGDDEVQLTGCSSTDEWVVVPETIEGKPVTKIMGNTFRDMDTMKTLVLNPSIVWVNGSAIVNCPNFTTLYLCDNIERISDGFYRECPEFSNLRLGAVLDPTRMTNRGGTFHIKFQRLMKAKAEGKDAFIVLSGSSSEYGFDSKVFEQEMNYAYYPVNFGTTAQISMLFFLELFSHFVDEGDIVVQAPETSESQLGGNSFVSYHWTCFEGVPEMFSYVDIRNYTKIFSTLTEFNQTRSKMKSNSYSDHHAAIDRYGDNITVRENPSPRYGAGTDKTFPTTNLKAQNAERLNRAYAALQEKGARVYFSFAPFNKNALAAAARKTEHQTAYQQHMEKMLNIPVISQFSNYLIEGKYFYDSNFHLINEGAVIRTQKLVADLKAQLEKEGVKLP